MTEAICPWLSSLPRYYVFIATKVKEITDASASVGLLLATAVLVKEYGSENFRVYHLSNP